MENKKYNKMLEIDKELTNFDFGEKMILCEYNSPDFFLELYRGNYNKSCRVAVDDERIVIELLEKNEIAETKIVDEIDVIKQIKDIMIKNLKDIVNLTLKLSLEYIVNNGVENSYTDNMLLKYGNIILKIDNGSIRDKQANKIIDSIYEIIV